MAEEKITPETFPRAGPDPLLAGLPEYLKDLANYEKVQRALLETLATKHSHGDLATWAACFPCQRRMRDHAEMVRKLGFTSPAQYYAWHRIHRTIQRRVPLPKYNT